MIARAEDSARAARQAVLNAGAKRAGASLLQTSASSDVDVKLHPPAEDAAAIAASLKGLSAVVVPAALRGKDRRCTNKTVRAACTKYRWCGVVKLIVCYFRI